MTAELLSQLETLSVETARLRDRLRRLRNASPIPQGNSSGGGGGGNAGDPVGDMVLDSIELEEQVKSNTERMDEIINTEPKADIRMLLRLRFVDRLPWRYISSGQNYSETAAYQKYKRYKKSVN